MTSQQLSLNINCSNPLAPNSSNNSLKNPLLHAWHDPLSGLKTQSSCMKLADLDGDGDFKLIVCEMDKKLRVYKGTSLKTEYAVLDTPVAICVTFTEATMPKVPSVAVAAGSHVFIYRQFRAYRKWTCPATDLSEAEIEVWNNLKEKSINVTVAARQLIEYRDAGTMLSARSTEFLSIESDVAKNNFVEDVKDTPLVQMTVITCMESVKKDSEDNDAISLLVVGTESGLIYILPPDPANSTFICKVSLPSPPTMMSISGLFDVEWRLSIVCRDGKLYNIKNGDVKGTAVLSGSIVDLGSQAVSISKQEKSLWVATMDRLVSCYSNRGKRLKGIALNEDVNEICVMLMKRSKVSSLLLVALSTGEISIYKDLTVVHSFSVDKPISAICCGVYGREENTLIVVSGQGALTIKIWKRTADIDNLVGNTGPPVEQDVPLNVPKKTKLYVEQTQREREKAPEIHRGFQRDLCKLRLTTARAYVKTLTDGFMGASPIGSQDVRIQVQVLGLGPKFLLKISLQNGSQQPLFQSRIVFSFDPTLYVMGHDSRSNQSICIPILLPGPKQIIETQILSIDPQGRSGQILLILCNTVNLIQSVGPMGLSGNPILSASIRMPACELFQF